LQRSNDAFCTCRNQLIKKGIGNVLVIRSLPFYVQKLKIQKLICEPYALNPSPYKMSKKNIVEFIKPRKTVPGPSNFEQEVNRWELTKDTFGKIA
jgi:ribosomal-protein-alanine N-acetyltransferase